MPISLSFQHGFGFQRDALPASTRSSVPLSMRTRLLADEALHKVTCLPYRDAAVQIALFDVHPTCTRCTSYLYPPAVLFPSTRSRRNALDLRDFFARISSHRRKCTAWPVICSLGSYRAEAAIHLLDLLPKSAFYRSALHAFSHQRSGLRRLRLIDPLTSTKMFRVVRLVSYLRAPRARADMRPANVLPVSRCQCSALHAFVVNQSNHAQMRCAYLLLWTKESESLFSSVTLDLLVQELTCVLRTF